MADSHELLNEAIATMTEAMRLLSLVGSSRELSLARTKLQEAQMWSQQHIFTKDKPDVRA